MDSVKFDRQLDTPLFPKVFWSRPVNRRAAGRLGVIGGHKGEFGQAYGVYASAVAAGGGECKLILPDTIRKLLPDTPDVYFAPSNPSGSLGKAALGEILQLSEELDSFAIGSNLSGNSETAIMIERLLESLGDKKLTVFDDTLRVLKFNSKLITDKPNVLIVLTLQELFKLAGTLKIPLQITSGDLENKVSIVATVSQEIQASLVVADDSLIVAAGGQISVTKVKDSHRLKPAIYGLFATFWMQHETNQSYQWLSSAAWIIAKAAHDTKPDDSSLNTINKSIESLLTAESL